jgi:hypothetical protein
MQNRSRGRDRRLLTRFDRHPEHPDAGFERVTGMFCGKSPTKCRPSMVLHKSRTKTKWHWAISLRWSRYCATNTGKNACATKNARMKAGIAGLKARSTKHSASNEM